MNDDGLLFLAMMVFTVSVEYFILRWRYGGRWSLARCILSVAAFSGVVWWIAFLVVHWGDTTEMEPPSNFSDWIDVGIIALAYLLGFMLVCLFPAGLAAWVYRKRPRWFTFLVL